MATGVDSGVSRQTVAVKKAGVKHSIVCRNIFTDFCRYLETENVSLESASREDVKQCYNTQYKLYRQQVEPDKKLPSFFKLFLVLYQQNIAHFHNNKVVIGPKDGNAKKKVRNKGRNKMKNHDMSVATTDSSIYPDKTTKISSTTRKAAITRHLHQKHNRYAVDQHLTFHTGLQKVVEMAGFQGNTAEWFNIGKDPNSDTFHCTVCQSKCKSFIDMEQHINGKRHRLATLLNVMKAKKKELVAGISELEMLCQGGGQVQLGSDGCLLMVAQENETLLARLELHNISTVPVELLHCEMIKKCRVFTLQDYEKVTDGIGKTVIISPGKSYTISVRAQPRQCGSYHCPVMFQTASHRASGRQTGYILRFLHCKCKNNQNSIIDELLPTSRYKKPPRHNRVRGRKLKIIEGLKPPSWSNDHLERKIKLKSYDVPESVRRMINRGLTNSEGLTETEAQNMDTLRAQMETELSMKNYHNRFSHLLFFEEVQMEVDIRRYDMEDVPMKFYPENKRLHILKVPGLSENRPSVLRGDWLYVRRRDPEGTLGEEEFQGYVHDVLLNEVTLGFNESFCSSFINNQHFNVRFVFNRLSTRLQHRACVLAEELSLGPVLFPGAVHLPADIPALPSLKLYNSDLERNPQQLLAVQHIVAGTSRPAPYLLFGPPGTGKTVTVVEAIKQIWKHSGDSHILACTPSNSAADLIARRLLEHVPGAEILRLNAASRTIGSVPTEIRDVCNYDKHTRQFYFQSKNILKDKRIIVSTLITAGRLVSASFPSEHFTHVFIDEAGHAPEPEAVTALAGIMEVNPTLKSGGQVVIAGDPKQLGPILRSPLALKFGLDISLLERYMETCPLYRPSAGPGGHRHYNPRVITKLLNNYRSHPAILKLPNELFYDSELQACASIDREKLCNWEKLPKQGFPVLFHGVTGEDMQEERSPSFFNPHEVAVVVEYVQELMSYRRGGVNLKETDIGVISPYRKQVQKIQQILRKRKLEKISVGSVEEFQGQERTVIIVSTVRSNPEHLSLDMRFRLGFLKNPKRFNVTMTRAKALLIVVGNPNTLVGDEYWRQLLDYCWEAGSWVGEERMSPGDAVEDLIQRLMAMELINDELQLIPELQSDFNEQAWRSEH